MSMRRILAMVGLLLLSGLLASCGVAAPDGDLHVSVVGDGFGARVDPDRDALAADDHMLVGATRMGLVAFDAQGQVEPGAGETWITTADGTSTIFRLRRAAWPDGREANGDDVAASIERALAPTSKNALKPLLSSIDAVVGMTGRVVELRLRVPRPNMLQLLAQPELGIGRAQAGLGPFRIASRRPGLVRLVGVDDDDETVTPLTPVTLRSERVSRAVARFILGKSDLVGGGTLADLPVAQLARPQSGRLRFDPIDGLFGLAIVGRAPFLLDVENRRALAKAIDRAALAAVIGLPRWRVRDAILPAPLDSARSAAVPVWSATSFDDRRAEAAARIARWQGSGGVPVLRVALPQGAGSRLLFAGIAADWRAIGVRSVAVGNDEKADLRLIDAIAPNASANWYLTSLSCAAGLVCDARSDNLLVASRSAETLDARSAAIADADATLTDRAAFISLGAPIRWSLVAPRLTGWRENVLGVHPLHRLRVQTLPQP